MAKHALDPAYRRVEVDEFLAMDLDGARAESEDGVIQMMAGRDEAHARIAANVMMFPGPRLRGTGCRPYGSDFAMRTEDRTVRYPDVSVYCNDPSAAGNATKQLLGDPQIIFEVLSSSTASHDQVVKLAACLELSGLREIVFVDPQGERARLLARTPDSDWCDDCIERGRDFAQASIGLTIPHAELFAAD